MEELSRDIEQLFEAGQQLGKRTQSGARLAIFLMDNLAELMMHRTASHWLEWDKHWHRPPKYTPEKRRKVTEWFNEKVNFLWNETKELNEAEANILKLGHRLRNEAYHRGVNRGAVIIAIASIYYEVVCNLHPRMWVGHYSITQDNEVIPNFFRSYGLEIGQPLVDKAVLEQLSGKFLEGKLCTISDLARTLSDDLVTRLDGGLEALSYIAENPRTSDDVLKHIQFYDKFWSEHTFPQTEEGARQYFQAWEMEYRSYAPSVTVARIERWRERSISLASETSLSMIVFKFDQLDLELLPVEDKIIEAAVAYDMAIDQQVQRMKEERRER